MLRCGKVSQETFVELTTASLFRLLFRYGSHSIKIALNQTLKSFIISSIAKERVECSPGTDIDNKGAPWFMLKTEEFKKKNQELQQIISEEICKAENGATDRNIYQLRTILKELLMMEQQCGVILSYPHIIVDSWDYSDVLGNRLMKLASMYEKVERL